MCCRCLCFSCYFVAVAVRVVVVVNYAYLGYFQMRLILWLNACCLVFKCTFGRKDTHIQLGYGNPETRFRLPRSALWFGNAAIKAILKNAVQVPGDSKQYITFLKTGGEREAIYDYNSLQPTFVNFDWKQYTTVGKIEDETLVSLRTFSKTSDLRPTIVMEKPGVANAIKIVYALQHKAGKENK